MSALLPGDGQVLPSPRFAPPATIPQGGNANFAGFNDAGFILVVRSRFAQFREKGLSQFSSQRRLVPYDLDVMNVTERSTA